MLPPLKIAYISRRPFSDGPVEAPFPESDPANIAHVLSGDYFSFLTFNKLSRDQIQQNLAAYDLIFLALDHRALDTVARIASACDDRLVTYSEGSVADYQMHGPAGQATFLQIINQARINFLYWENYVSFYQTLTDRPVHYLPYPYYREETARHSVGIADRALHVTLPSGLAGHTRNGLGSLVVARQLLRQGVIERVNCWLHPFSFAEDAQAIQFFVLGTAPPRRSQRFKWRRWLNKSGLDYRFLMRIWKRFRRRSEMDVTVPPIRVDKLALYRRRAWPQYLPELARTMLLVDLNNRETVGRNSLDCAALRVPCVSTDRSDMHRRLFPDLVLDDTWDIDGAVALCVQLLQDQAFYRACIQQAWSALPAFGPEAFRQRLASIFEDHPQLLVKI